MTRLLWLFKAWRRRAAIARLKDAARLGHKQRCELYLAICELNGLVWGS